MQIILSIALTLALLLGQSLSSLLPMAQATLPPVTNFAKVTLSTGYDSSATTIVLLSGHGSKLPSTFPFPLVWWNATDYGAPEDDPFVEVVSVTNRSGDTLTVVRAQEGTSAVNHNTGGKTYRMVLTLTKAMWDAIRTDIAAAAGGASMVHAGSGSPEGVLTATLGHVYLRTTDSISGTTLYTKTTDAGNTGWLPVLTFTNWANPGLIGGTTAAAANFTSVLAQRFIGTIATPTYGPSVTIDGSAGSQHIITATNATSFLIANPTTHFTGQQLLITVKNTSGGALGTVSWDTQYKMADFTVIKPATGFRRTITFIFDGTNWVEVNCSPAVPN